MAFVLKTRIAVSNAANSSAGNETRLVARRLGNRHRLVPSSPRSSSAIGKSRTTASRIRSAVLRPTSNRSAISSKLVPCDAPSIIRASSSRLWPLSRRNRRSFIFHQIQPLHGGQLVLFLGDWLCAADERWLTKHALNRSAETIANPTRSYFAVLTRIRNSFSNRDIYVLVA